MPKKINVDKQFPATQSSLAKILKSYGVSGFSFEKAKSGIENSTLIVSTADTKLVLRIYRQDKKTTEEIERELAFMQMLANQKVPVPKLIWNSDKNLVTITKIGGVSWQSIAMAFVVGGHQKKYTPALIKDMAHIQARMHLLGLEFAKNYQGLKNQLPFLKEGYFVSQIDWDKIDDPKLLEFRKRIEAFQVNTDKDLPLGFGHFDYDIENIISSSAKVKAVLDFDDMVYAPVVICLGYTLYHVLRDTKSDELTRNYIQEYEKFRKLTNPEKDILKQIILFRHYVISALLIAFYGYSKRKPTKFLQIEKRIRELQI